jgi:hypothetical protein
VGGFGVVAGILVFALRLRQNFDRASAHEREK